MAMIHIPTVYLFLSFIFILMPVAIWIALNNQRSRSIIWWCAGGELFAIGLLLVGLDVIGDCLTEVNVTSPTCSASRFVSDARRFCVAIRTSAIQLVHRHAERQRQRE